LGFLGRWPFRRESPSQERWIFLDFLGFSRSNLDLSMGYAGFSSEEISRTLLPADRAGTADAAVEVIWIRGIIHDANLAQFLFFVNLSSSNGQFFPDNSAIQS
jgi:hypothetical protein